VISLSESLRPSLSLTVPLKYFAGFGC